MITRAGVDPAQPTKEEPTVRTASKAKLGLAGLGAVAMTLAATVPAFADYAPGPSDVVGVGGDTPQFDVAFAADGDTLGDVGFNSSHPVNRLVPFLATADNNARAGYVSGTSTNINPTVVLRAGESPVERVPSSGAAITALLADNTKPYTINFIFSASEPTLAQQNTAADPTGDNFGFLHVVQIAKDGVVMVGQTGGNAPAGLSIAELLSIYDGTVTKWNDLPGNSGGSAATIIPQLPPTSSSIYKTLIADLTTQNSNTAPTLANPNIVHVEQNDPSAITSANAIVPFSSARLALQKSSYFRNPNTPFPGGAGVDPTVSALTGTTPDAATAYNSEVDHYIIFRQSDANSTTPMEPGSSLNWVNTLFSESSAPNAPLPFFDTAAGQADIAAAGSTPVYNDLGNVHNG
jgi:ABC-type phosphate transport system substrate-binding protein